MTGLNIARRDLNCVCCDFRLYTEHMEPVAAWISQHHRILGNRKDNRDSNGILLEGSGSRGHHWCWHNPDRREAERLGYIVSRFGPPERTLTVPVYYKQPSLGRVGWYRLDDRQDMHLIAFDPGLWAVDLAERITTDGGTIKLEDQPVAGGEVPPGAAAAVAAPGPGPGHDTAGADPVHAGGRVRPGGPAQPAGSRADTLTCACGGELFRVSYRDRAATSAACGSCGAAQLFDRH